MQKIKIAVMAAKWYTSVEVIMIAVIGDIVDSRRLQNREETQNRLMMVLKKVNNTYSSNLVSAFIVTLGDEFQGVVNSDALHILDEISMSMHPTKLRFGLGIGTILTQIDRGASIGADGPAYWSAREAIKFAHKDNDYGYSNIHLLISENESSEHVQLINEILKLTAIMANNWNPTQIEVMKALLDEGIWSQDFDQKSIAKKIGRSDSSLTRRLATSGIKRYLQSRGKVQEVIERINSVYE